MVKKTHQTIRKVTEDFDSRWHFNTSLAAIMELLNDLYAAEEHISAGAMQQVLERLVLLLGPFVPYVAEEMWAELGKPGPVFKQPWPAYDPELARALIAKAVETSIEKGRAFIKTGVDCKLKVIARVIRGRIHRETSRGPMLKSLVYGQDDHSSSPTQPTLIQHPGKIRKHSGILTFVVIENFTDSIRHDGLLRGKTCS